MDKAFIATEGNLQSSSVFLSSPEALAHTKWREALEFRSVCVLLWLMKLIVCQNGRTIL